MEAEGRLGQQQSRHADVLRRTRDVADSIASCAVDVKERDAFAAEIQRLLQNNNNIQEVSQLVAMSFSS